MAKKLRNYATISTRSLSEREKAIFLHDREALPKHATLQDYCLITRNTDIAFKLINENKELLREFMI